MCIWRASNIIFLGVKICQNAKCLFLKSIFSHNILSFIGNNHETSKKCFVKFSPILDSDFSLERGQAGHCHYPCCNAKARDGKVGHSKGKRVLVFTNDRARHRCSKQ